MQYFYNLYIAVDQLLNVLVFFGDPKQTISAHMGQVIAEGRCKACGYFCKVLDFFQTDHCNRAYLHELHETIDGHDDVAKL